MNPKQNTIHNHKQMQELKITDMFQILVKAT